MDEYGERQELGFAAAQRQGGMPSGDMLYRGLAVAGEESSDGVLGKDSGSEDERFVERGKWKVRWVLHTASEKFPAVNAACSVHTSPCFTPCV
jgi:hypothetical protein